jgi:hypothetical protein
LPVHDVRKFAGPERRCALVSSLGYGLFQRDTCVAVAGSRTVQVDRDTGKPMTLPGWLRENLLADIAYADRHQRMTKESSSKAAFGIQPYQLPEPTRADLDEPRGHAGENGAAGFAVGWLRCLVDPLKWLF